ncbi:MAG TPA: hypothetical protein ENJ00_02405 [Phycisphaerales bacterium]|nr:hypothetical protein [Phycisphaerales bacterium]
MTHARKMLSILILLTGVLAPGIGCASRDLPDSYFAERPNPGSTGYIPILKPLSTGTRHVAEKIAAFDGFQTTGIAVTPAGQLFLSSPRWHGNHGMSVIQVFTGKLTPPMPYPDADWNNWGPGARPERSWVCVQALLSDDLGRLWVLDSGAPLMQGPIDGAAKLVRIDPTTGKVEAVFLFDNEIAPEGSYLNDVRIDTASGFAYITDSGLGAIVAVDLSTGAAARFLEDHPSTKAEPDVRLVIDGKPWVNAKGKTPMVHVDGIALSPDGEYIYYQALTSRRLYRARTAPIKAALRSGNFASAQQRSADQQAVADTVESLGQTFVTDGMMMDRRGTLYFTALERNAITARLATGELTKVTAGEDLVWPDGLAIQNGRLYFTVARINETGFNRPEGAVADGPFAVYRVPLLDPKK